MKSLLQDCFALWGCTRQDLLVVAGVIFVFAMSAVWWVNSPGYKAEQAYQRQHAVKFLIQHRYGMLPQDIQEVMDKFQIAPFEIAIPPLMPTH